jgi:hypothetical protein
VIERVLFRNSKTVRGSEFATEIASLLEEVGRMQVDWSTYSLESAQERVLVGMRACDNNLSDIALRALAWKLTFDWR